MLHLKQKSNKGQRLPYQRVILSIANVCLRHNGRNTPLFHGHDFYMKFGPEDLRLAHVLARRAKERLKGDSFYRALQKGQLSSSVVHTVVVPTCSWAALAKAGAIRWSAL